MGTNNTQHEAALARKSARRGAAPVPERTGGNNFRNEVPVSSGSANNGAKSQGGVGRFGPPAVDGNPRQKSDTPGSKALQEQSSHKAGQDVNRSHEGGRDRKKRKGPGRSKRSGPAAVKAVPRQSVPEDQVRRGNKGLSTQTEVEKVTGRPLSQKEKKKPKPKFNPQNKVHETGQNLNGYRKHGFQSDILPKAGHRQRADGSMVITPVVKSPLGRRALNATSNITLTQLYDLVDQKFTGTVVVNQTMDTAFDVIALLSGSALRREGDDTRTQMALNVPKFISPKNGQMVQTPFLIDLCDIRYVPLHRNGRDFVNITVLASQDGTDANLKMTYALAYIEDLKPKLAYMVKMLSSRKGEYLIRGKWKADALSGVLLAFLYGVKGNVTGAHFIANEDQDSANVARLMTFVREMNGGNGWEAVIGMTSDVVASLLNIDVGDADISMPIRKDLIPIEPPTSVGDIAPALARVDLNKNGCTFVMWKSIDEAVGFLLNNRRLIVYCHAPQFSVDGVVKPHFHVCHEEFNVFSDLFEKGSRALEAPVVLMMRSMPNTRFLVTLARWMEVSFNMCRHSDIKVEATAVAELSDSDLAGWYHVRYAVTSTSENLSVIQDELAKAFEHKDGRSLGQPDFRYAIDNLMANEGGKPAVTGGGWRATPSSESGSRPVADPLDHIDVMTTMVGYGSRVPVLRRNVFAEEIPLAGVYAGDIDHQSLMLRPMCARDEMLDLNQWAQRNKPALVMNGKNHFRRNGLDVLEIYRGQVEDHIRVSPLDVWGYAFDSKLDGVLNYALGCYRREKPAGWEACRARIYDKFFQVFGGQKVAGVLNLHIFPGDDLLAGCESLAIGESERLITCHNGQLKAVPVRTDCTVSTVFFDEVTSGYGADTAPEAYDALFLMIGHLIAGCNRGSGPQASDDKGGGGASVSLIVNFHATSEDNVLAMCQRRFGKVFTNTFCLRSGCKVGGFVECCFTMNREVLFPVLQVFPESSLADFLITAHRAGVRLTERIPGVKELTSDLTCEGRLVFGVANSGRPDCYVYSSFHYNDIIYRTFNGIIPSSGTGEYTVLADSQGSGYIDVLIAQASREYLTLVRFPSLDTLSCKVQPEEVGAFSTIVAESNEALAHAVSTRHSSSFLSVATGADGNKVFTSRGMNGPGGVLPKFDISYTTIPLKSGNIPNLTTEYAFLRPSECFNRINSHFIRGERYSAQTDKGFPGEIRWSELDHTKKAPGACMSPAELYKLLRPYRVAVDDRKVRTYYHMWMAIEVGSSTVWKCLTVPKQGWYADYRMVVGIDHANLIVPRAPGVNEWGDGTFYERVNHSQRAMKSAVIQGVKDAVVVVINRGRVTGELSLTGEPGMKSVGGVETHLTITDIMCMGPDDRVTMSYRYLNCTDIKGGFGLSDSLSRLTMGDARVPTPVAPYKHKVNVETVFLPISHGVKDSAVCLALIAVGIGGDFHLGLASWWFSGKTAVPLSLVGNAESLYLDFSEVKIRLTGSQFNVLSSELFKLENSLHFILYAHVKSRNEHELVAQSLRLCCSVDGQNNKDVLIIYPLNEAWSDLAGLIDTAQECSCPDELLTVELAGGRVLIFKRGMAAKLCKRMNDRCDDLNSAGFMNVEPFIDELYRSMVLVETPMPESTYSGPLLEGAASDKPEAPNDWSFFGGYSPIAADRMDEASLDEDNVDDLVVQLGGISISDALSDDEVLDSLLQLTLAEFVVGMDTTSP